MRRLIKKFFINLLIFLFLPKFKISMRHFLSFLFTLAAFAAIGQNGIIRGSVIEESNGETIIGVNVYIKDTSIGTVTDLDGEFTLEVDPGTYTVEVSYIGYQTVNIEDVEVKAGEVSLLNDIRLSEETQELEEIVVTAKAVRTTEAALLTLKKKAPAMLDGISSARFKLTGDATAVEAAKRVTGVSVEGGKYVYVRGLGDRYSKTTLNGVEIPGLDPDRNTLQMDIFPTNLLDNIVISKNFTADLPADFTGGLLNVETKDFPDEKVTSVSVSTSFNPDMHLNSSFLDQEGGNTDFLGFDDGTRDLPEGARGSEIITPLNSNDQEVNDFVNRFNPNLGGMRQTSFLDYSVGISLGNQINLKGKKEDENGLTKDKKLGYIFSLSYKTDYKFYDDVVYGEFQRVSNSDVFELDQANLQTGEVGERNFLIGVLGGLAYKTESSKYRLTAMRLQNAERRSGQFLIDNNGEAIGQSGYLANSDNLEYNERSLTNVLFNGTHVLQSSGWEIDWRVSPTYSTSDDPDIRKTAFTFLDNGGVAFNAGAGGNPIRIWRSLSEWNVVGKFDISKKYQFSGRDAKLKFGASHTYKYRDYEILSYGVQFFGPQPDWTEPDPNVVLQPENLFPNGTIYYQADQNSLINPNQYESNVNNTGVYVSNEFDPAARLKAIVGLRAENFVQRHTGRDQLWANGDTNNGNALENEKVLDALDLFPSVNFIYEMTDQQNIRLGYSRTIARPSFKELSFAQIIDPITGRIFNGGLFPYDDWDGNLKETRIHNIDLRWEFFLERGQIFSVSAFYKEFDAPIELIRIAEAQTIPEFQPRNVGKGQVFGLELEARKDLDFISPALKNFNISGNVTFVESIIEMTEREFNARKNQERSGETIEDTRQMAGQAPYVINLGVSYNNYDSGIDAGLFYNVKGETLEVISSGLYPDVYFQPFHSLNFTFNKRLGKNRNSAINLKVSNILNDKWESFYESFEAENQIFSSFSPGIAIGLGFSHQF
jgi:hypothetical protein